jgi:hypothetical protein
MGDEQTPETGASSIAGVEIPADLTTLDERGIETLKTKVAKAFEKINSKDRLTAEELADLSALTDAMTGLRAAETALAESAAEAQRQRAELAEKMGVSPTTEEGDKEPVETVAEVVPDGDKPVDEAVEGEEEKATDEQNAQTVIEALAASLRPEGRGSSTTARPVPAARTRIADRSEGISIVASSGIPGTDTGKRLDQDGLSIALHERARMMGDQRGNGEKGALVASIVLDKPANDLRGLKGDDAIRAAWQKAHDEYNARLMSRVASGGFCAPSTTIYDFVCDFEAMPEVLDLPSITENRGGVRFPESPLLGDVFDDVDSGFTWTEDDDIDAAAPGGPTKPCFVIPCPEFDEVRLQAQGICVTAGNLMDRAYPELTNRYVDLVMTAHAHRMNGLTIAKVEAGSVAVPSLAATTDDLSAAEAILAVIELQIARSRDQFFMSDDQTLEVVLPRWTRTVMRRDLARRAGIPFVQSDNTTIDGYFGEIGARVQFVSNWQSLRVTGAYTGQVALPTSVKTLIYPSGAHTRLDGGSIDLGVVRDSTLNATNDYTAAWTEEFWQVLSRCFSLVATIPICAKGWTGVGHDIACPTA